MGIDRRCQDWPRITEIVEGKRGKLHWYVAGDGSNPNLKYDRIDPTEIPKTWRGYPNSYKAYLCFRDIIKRAKAENLQSILILEDDIQVTEDFDNVLNLALMQMKMDSRRWDMLYLGANHTWSKTYEVSPNLLKLNGSVCWHAIGLQKTVFDAILNLPMQYPIDAEAATLHNYYDCYAVWPSIVIQRPGFSEVEGRVRDYSEFWSCKGNPCVQI